MAEAEEGRRPRRGCVQRRTAMPSAVHYVGYVEDDETPEMIMKKFEELERVREQAKMEVKSHDADLPDDQQNKENVPGEHLNDEQLLEVFKQTSMFNVKTVLVNNEVLLHGGDQRADGNGGEDFLLSDDDSDVGSLEGFWSGNDDDFEFDDEGRPKNRRQGAKGERTRRLPGEDRCTAQQQHIIKAYNNNYELVIKRRVKTTVDRDAIVKFQLPPPPIPLPWGRIVKPLQRPTINHLEYHELQDLTSFDFKRLKQKRTFIGVLINCGWEMEEEEQHARITQRLRKIPVNNLCPTGFIFIWAEKEFLASVVKLMDDWGFLYIENLTWVLLHPNNSILKLDYKYTRKSHLTLLIFRKNGEGKDIELRHQRNPDVVFDTVRFAECCKPGGVPSEVYKAIETLLPTGKDKFLELWAEKGVSREGWTHLVELPTD